MKERKVLVPNKFLIEPKDKDTGELKYGHSAILKETKKKDIVYLHITLMQLTNYLKEGHSSLAEILYMMGYPKQTRYVNGLRSGLKILESYGYFIIKQDINDIKLSEFFSFEYDPFDYNDEDKMTSFFVLWLDDVEKLIQLEDGRTTYNYLNVYAYITCRRYKLPKKEVYNIFGHYEVCMPSYDEFMDMLHMHRNNIKQTLEELEELEYIYYDNAGKYKYKKSIKQASNTYTTTRMHDYKRQVEQSIKYYREKTAEEYAYQWYKK